MNQDPSEKWPVLEPKQEIYKVSPKYLTVPKSNEKKKQQKKSNNNGREGLSKRYINQTKRAPNGQTGKM